MNLSIAEYGVPVHGYVKSLTKEKQDGIYACSWEKLRGKIPMRLQVVLSKCITRTHGVRPKVYNQKT